MVAGVRFVSVAFLLWACKTGSLLC
jgi:hypothetical protein